MTSGKKPKPSLLKLAGNTMGSAALAAAAFEPIPQGELGDPPSTWAPDSVELLEWHYALRNCPKGMLKSTDRRALISWCDACAAYDELDALIRKHGRVYIVGTNGAQTSSPYVTQQEKAFMRLRRLAAELGFTPSARTRIQVAPGEQANGSAWARLKQKADEPDDPADEVIAATG